MPGYDRISELPEALQTQILSYLPTKDSVKTSVLSTKWKNLWLNVSGLDLNCHDFRYEDSQVIINFIDRFLEFNPESRLQKFKVNHSSVDISQFKERIGSAVNRGIQHLDLESNTYYRDDSDGLIYPCINFMPLNLYTSKTLVSLKLSSSGLEDPGFVSMPCLKFMDLKEIQWRDPMSLEKLISGCPVLEELTLVRDLYEESAVTGVRSRSLKRFCVPLEHGDFCQSRVESTLEIDAPQLEYMSLKEDHFDRCVVKNLSGLFMIKLGIKFLVKFGMFFDPEDLSKRNEIGNFLTGISSVRHMIISQHTLKALDLYSKLGPIPKFNNLSRVEAVFPSALLQFFPTFLESCPNLKHLIVNFVYSEEMEEFKLINVPQCFSSTLECVEIKGFLDWEEVEIKVVSYFLENSSVLKKLMLSFVESPPRERYFYIHEELDKLKKRSPRCQIICEC